MSNTIGILTMQRCESRRPGTVGSSRIRGEWLAEAWDGAELFVSGRKYAAVIYQKSYLLDHMRAFGGLKVFDFADPDWLDGRPVREALELCDACAASTEALAAEIRKFAPEGMPVRCIPDRVLLSAVKVTKEHRGRARTCVWFGYSQNQEALDACLPTLKRLGLGLAVVSDQPYLGPRGAVDGIDAAWIATNVTNVPYDHETANEDIVAAGDIVLNPRLDTPRFRLKSNNKSLQAWALGMPVAEDSDDLEALLDEKSRTDEAVRRMDEVRRLWDVKLSAGEYDQLLREAEGYRAARGGR